MLDILCRPSISRHQRPARSNAHVNTCRLKPTFTVTTRVASVWGLRSSHVNRNGCRCASEYVFPSEPVCGLHRIKPAAQLTPMANPWDEHMRPRSCAEWLCIE